MTTLPVFLNEMSLKFTSDFAAFEVYQFMGTGSEITSSLATWRRPVGVEIHHLDIAEVTADSPNPVSARLAIDDALQKLASHSGRMLLSLRGVHLLASLYPGGLLQPINGWLRRGSRVVILAVPTIHSLRFPEPAMVGPWRDVLSNELGNTHSITNGSV